MIGGHKSNVVSLQKRVLMGMTPQFNTLQLLFLSQCSYVYILKANLDLNVSVYSPNMSISR